MDGAGEPCPTPQGYPLAPVSGGFGVVGASGRVVSAVQWSFLRWRTGKLSSVRFYCLRGTEGGQALGTGTGHRHFQVPILAAPPPADSAPGY